MTKKKKRKNQKKNDQKIRDCQERKMIDYEH